MLKADAKNADIDNDFKRSFIARMDFSFLKEMIEKVIKSLCKIPNLNIGKYYQNIVALREVTANRIK
jgi:hypothetical protein